MFLRSGNIGMVVKDACATQATAEGTAVKGAFVAPVESMVTRRAANLLLALGHNYPGLGIIVLSGRPDGGRIDILGVDPGRSARTGHGQEHVRTVLEQATDLRDWGEGASGLLPRADVQGLEMVQEQEGNTVLTGPVIDRAALHCILSWIRDLGEPSLSVKLV